MSQKSYVVLTAAVTFAIPQGKTKNTQTVAAQL